MEYQVDIGECAERYYIKNFSKKYQKAWDVTLEALIESVRRLDTLVLTDKAETIVDAGGIRIFKIYFRIHKSKDSALKSGCRAIVATDEGTKRAYILIVYHKSDIAEKNETVTWKKLVKELYPKYIEIL
jgi:hypothetical protein